VPAWLRRPDQPRLHLTLVWRGEQNGLSTTTSVSCASTQIRVPAGT
jgi:hypothetical protein